MTDDLAARVAALEEAMRRAAVWRHWRDGSAEVRIALGEPRPNTNKPVRYLHVRGCSACGASHNGLPFEVHPFADGWVGKCPAEGITIFARDVDVDMNTAGPEPEPELR